MSIRVFSLLRRISATVALGLATSACTTSSSTTPEETGMAVAREDALAVADPAKLLVSPPGVLVLQARISAILRVKDGCLVIGAREDQTVVWPAGTVLSLDRRAVVVGGSGKVVPIGSRFAASGGQVPLDSPPSALLSAAISHGCPGSLAAVGEVL
ncbi:MAG TPA: hypothetical protein VFZ91_09985 [Allosphingosinicella sp.]